MTQEKISVLDVQCFQSWEKLPDLEAAVCRHLFVLTWGEDLTERRVTVREVARGTGSTPELAHDALRSLYARGALTRLEFIEPDLVLVALTQGWRMEETP